MSKDHFVKRHTDPFEARELFNQTDSPHLDATTTVEVLHRLDSSVLDFLNTIELDGATSCHAEDIPHLVAKIEASLRRGKALHTTHPFAVVRVNRDIVIKTCEDGDDTEVTALLHIREHSPSIPTPNLLGAVSYRGVIRIFMSYIEGCPLNEYWSSMSPNQKATVQNQVAEILAELRRLPLPSEYLGGGSPPRCVDFRMTKRQSEAHIRNEAGFNDFLLANPRRRISSSYLRFLRDHCLRSDHRLVMTHGDFAARNIIVREVGDCMEIVGLVDWECAGAYPEHWEYVKALDTFSCVEDDDWYDYLPTAAMGRYTAEWATCMIVERLTS